jgi:hypothetical protein
VFDEGAAVMPSLELGDDPRSLARALTGLLR